MESFPGYVHIEKVHEFPQSVLFRAQNEYSGQPVLLKRFKRNYSNTEFQELKHLFDADNIPKSPVISAPTDLLLQEGNIILVFQDTGSMFLSIMLLGSKLSIEDFLETAIRISRHLGELHTTQIVHNDIRPQNILLNERDGSVTFTGFSFIYSTSGKNRKKHPETLGEDLHFYTSPEQTGRIDWDIDQKSDLYSLGATFYEMLAGRPPFNQGEQQKRIQSHLVSEPPSLISVRQEIPEAIDGIVRKLLSKGPEDRYQSAFGLLKDLENCRDQYKANKTIETFDLAQKDNIEQLNIPSKLYGSQENYVSLIESFNRVTSGSVEMMILEGKAGMGKTTLIRELLALTVQKGAYAGHGKCEKEYRDTPYYSLIIAFQKLVREILSEGNEKIQMWKKRFLDALGHNGQLVVDFIPEFELIVGPQPAVPKVNSDEAQNRLNHTFRRFVQTFTMDGNPLVIFLDSFQWADLSTIQLIQAALSDIGSRYIMLIVAFQKHLISHSNAFDVSMEEIANAGTTIQRISVEPLGLKDISQMIEEALSFKQDFTSLAQYILEKSEGNPYFVKQLLTTIHEKKLIHFDPAIGRWTWDLARIKRAKIPGHIVDLMAEKVRRLQPDSVAILKLASCIGNQFDIKTLALAAEMDEASVLKLLDEPLEAGLIKRVNRSNRMIEAPDFTREYGFAPATLLFQFTHSRVLRAAYSLLKVKERKVLHLTLGRLLLEKFTPEEIEKNAYQIVNQMNQGIQLIKSQAEKHELARLNLLAGRKSKAAAAFETAWKYFSIGSELLTEKSWEEKYKLSKDLFLKRSECEYYIGKPQAAEPIFNLLLKHIKTNREKVEVINLKLNLYIKNNQLDEAIGIGLEALNNLFSEEIPPNDAEVTMVSQIKMQDIQEGLEQRKIENLLFLPEMADQDRVAMMELITNIIPAAYIVRRNLWILLTLKMVEYSLSYGNSDTSAYGYMNYAVILCSGLQDYSNGYAIGQMALELNDKFKRFRLTSQLNFLFGSFIGHWKKKAIGNVSYLKRSFRAGIEHGDFISAGQSVDFLMKTLLIVGSPLEEIQKEVKKHQDFIDQLNNPDLAAVVKISQLMLQLRESNPDSKEFLPDLNLPKPLLKHFQESKNTQLKQWYYLINAQIQYFFYNYTEALRLIQESDKHIASYSQLAISEHYFYYSLIIVENYNNFSEEDKKRYWDILRNNQQRLSNIAAGCAINFSDKELIISALMAGISGNYIKTGDLFDAAVKAANQNGFIQNEAVANELAAKYFLSRNKETIALAYLRKACLAYTKWGAMAKLRQLEFNYPNLLKKRQRYDDTVVADTGEESQSLFADLGNIVGAIRELSDEPTFEKTVHKLLVLLLESTKASKAYFLTEENSQFRIVAEGVKKRKVKTKKMSHLLEEFSDIAQSVVFYVIRTRKRVVLDDAGKDSLFAYNEYIKRNHPKSILCMPLINHGKMYGILYLENTRSVRVFTPKLIEMLDVLVSQVSILIENKLLHEEIEEKTKSFESNTKQLQRRIRTLEQELKSRLLYEIK